MILSVKTRSRPWIDRDTDGEPIGFHAHWYLFVHYVINGESEPDYYIWHDRKIRPLWKQP